MRCIIAQSDVLCCDVCCLFKCALPFNLSPTEALMFCNLIIIVAIQSEHRYLPVCVPAIL